ncbi:MAG: flagellar motor protein MotB [Acidobacteriota bacterium]
MKRIRYLVLQKQVTWLAIACTFLGPLTGCVVGKDRYEKALDQSNALRSAVEDCSRSRDDLLRERQDLVERIQDLEKDHQGLLEQLVRMESELGVMGERIRFCDEQAAIRENQTAGISRTYEAFAGRLSGEIDEGKIQIDQSERGLKLNLVGKILFPSGSAELTLDGKQILEKVGFVLKEIRDRKIQIEGHADNTPISPSLRSRFASNWELSALRASAVARFLEEQSGIDPRLIAATGYSSYQPVSENETPDGREQNRRIEIVLSPLTTGEMTRLYGESSLPPPASNASVPAGALPQEQGQWEEAPGEGAPPQSQEEKVEAADPVPQLQGAPNASP